MAAALKIGFSGPVTRPGWLALPLLLYNWREIRRVADMMLLCPICAGEFEVPQAPLCPGCGVRLVPESIETMTDPSEEIEFEELCRPQGYSIAMLVKQMLEQNGIAAIVQGGHSMSVLPSLSFLGQMRVLVDKRHMSYARQLYEAYFEGGGSDLYEID